MSSEPVIKPQAGGDPGNSLNLVCEEGRESHHPSLKNHSSHYWAESFPTALPGRLSIAPFHPSIVEQPNLRRCSAGREFSLVIYPFLQSEVFEYLADHHRVFDAGNDPHRTLTLLTGVDVDVEHPLQSLCPRHGRMALYQCFVIWIVFIRRLLLAPLPRPDGVTSALCLLLGANTPWKRVRLTRGLGTRAASLAIKSSGSKMTWVVPLRNGVFSS